MIQRFIDFRGGYQSNLAPDLTPQNVVKTGENLYWLGKIRKRPGFSNYSADTTINTETVRGVSPRVRWNNTWYTVVAIDDDTDVGFYYGNTGSYTQLTSPAEIVFTTGKNVEMRVINNMIIAVNEASDWPVIMYYDSGFKIQYLEDYDERVRTDDEWYAGQWDDGETPPFIDDTTDAQDDGTDDFSLATTTDDDGFYVSGVTTFNKIVVNGAPQFDGSPVAEYAYYAGGGTWTTVTPTTAPTWTAAATEKTIEFDLPFDSDGDLLWLPYGDVGGQMDPTGVPGGALQRYIFRVRFTTAPTSAQVADYLSISNTQYLRQIFLNVKPEALEIHKSRVFLATGTTFRYSPPNQVTGWNSRDIEYIGDGGITTRCMVSSNAFLAIFKEAGVYRYFGTTTQNFVLRSYPQEGCTSKRGAAYIGNVVIYTAHDGIRVLAGEESIMSSNHIRSDYEGWTKTNTVVRNYNGNILVSFPSSDILLWADPDQVKPDELNAGDMMASFWKWTGHAFDEMWYAEGAGDTEQLIAHDMDNNRLVKSNANAYDTNFAGTNANIACVLETSFSSQGALNTKRHCRRVKIDMSKSGDWTLTLTGDNGDATATATIVSGTGATHHYADVSIPYTLDGQNISFKLANTTANAVEIFGFSVDLDRRAF